MRLNILIGVGSFRKTLLLLGLFVIASFLYFILEYGVPIALFSSRGFSFSLKYLKEYIALSRSKRASEVLRSIQLYRAFYFKNEDIPYYIQLSKLPSGPEILEGLSAFNENPAIFFSKEGIKQLSEFNKVNKPLELLSNFKKAGFMPHKGRLVHFEPYFIVPFSRKEYALKLSRNRPYLEELILKELNIRAHTFPKEADHSEMADEVKRLNAVQLLKVYTALESLQKEDLIKMIAQELRKDVEDHSSEHGGIVVFDNHGRLKIEVYPSMAKGDNNSYLPPSEAIKSKKFSDFHMHARSEDETIFAGPSDILGGDLNVPLKYAKQNLPYTALLFTKLKGKAFNADIYFGNPEDPLWPVVVDLGNYSYQSIF